MRIWKYFLVVALGLVGCSNPKFADDEFSTDNLFSASAMRIHPIFSQLKDWTGDGAPDGIEALVEFQDPFGDPTKAAGTIRFELYDYVQGQPDPKGARVTNPWIGSLASHEDQKSRWNRTSRTYSFQLAMSRFPAHKDHILIATFKPSGEGPRLFSQIVIPAAETPEKSDNIATTQPGFIPGM